MGSLPRGGSYIIMEFVEFGASRSGQVRMDWLKLTVFIIYVASKYIK